MDREQILNDMLHQIAFNGGRVNAHEFIIKCQMLYGRTDGKIVEYLKLLEAVGQTKVQDFNIILTDMSRVKAIWKVRIKKKAEDFKDDPDAKRIDEMLGFT